VNGFQRVLKGNRATSVQFQNVAILAEPVASLPDASRREEITQTMSLYLDDVDGALNELIGEHEWEVALKFALETCVRSYVWYTTNEVYLHARAELISSAESRTFTT
jgi:hypothetical protein